MEVINSFFSNIKDKLTNPFFGTLILVLIIHHWVLWYTIFNFDDDCTLDDKIFIIQHYVSNNLSWHMFICDVLKAAIIMFLGYAIVLGTRSISMWFEYNLMVNITEKIRNKKVVGREEFEDVEKERDNYFDQYKEQRKNVREFSKTIDEQTEQIKLKDETYLELTTTADGLRRELETTKTNLATITSKFNLEEQMHSELKVSAGSRKVKFHTVLDLLQGYENLFYSTESREYYNSIDKFPQEIIRKVQELKNENLWLDFIELGVFYSRGGNIDSFIMDKLIEKGVTSGKEFTAIGKIIWHYRNIFNNKN